MIEKINEPHKKGKISILLSLALLFSLTSPIFAVDNTAILEAERILQLATNSLVCEPHTARIGLGIDAAKNLQPRYISSCPYSDKHMMVGRGTGKAYYGSVGSTDLRINGGSATQCKYCNLVLITEGNPFQFGPQPWGNYATWGAEEPMTGIVVIMYTTSFGYSSGYSGDMYVQGFEFSSSGRKDLH